MMYYIAAIAMFVLVGYIIHKLAYKRFEKLNGRKPKRREIYSIYHWESVLGLSAVVILILVYVLKISNILPL